MIHRESNKQRMIEIVEEHLPGFVRAIKAAKDAKLILHQDAFAADYQGDEFTLLGMAIKYAGLYNREVIIVPNR